MYKVTVPIMNDSVNAQTRGMYLAQCKVASVDRIYLATPSFRYSQMPLLTENIRYFQENGIEVAVWIGETMGHMGSKTNIPANAEGWHYMQDAEGEFVADCYCPLDPGFSHALAQSLIQIAKTGVKLIQLDDDFRLSSPRGTQSPLLCCCSSHRKLMEQHLGKNITDTQLQAAFSDEPNAVRRAFLKASGDSLRMLASKLRDAVDTVDENIRISLCCSWGKWDLDGVDVVELSRILAGKNQAMLRTCGAPYWAQYHNRLTSVIECARMTGSFCRRPDIEVLSEGDSYPRPRYRVPASWMEVYDVALRAEGAYDGILKYMFDYTSTPNYETGYLEHHGRNLPVMNEISRVFREGVMEGVRVYAYPHKLQDQRIPEDSFIRIYEQPDIAGDILASSGIPTVYDGRGLCGLAFGDDVKYIDKTAFENGLILDAPAAKILFEKGIDVGIRSIRGYAIEQISTERFVNGETVAIMDRCRLLNAQYAPNITVESYATLLPNQNVLFPREGGLEEVLSYRYENGEGQKFLVLNFAMDETVPKNLLKQSYARQKQLIAGAEWFSGKKLPGVITGQPEIYTILKRKEKSLLVAVLNCFADPLYHPVIPLDRTYRSVSWIAGDGELEGDHIRISGTVGGYTFLAFEVFE